MRNFVKAFESIDHKLIFVLLEKTVIPNSPLQASKNLYKNFKFDLKIGKRISLIDDTAGIKEGDNLALTLFM